MHLLSCYLWFGWVKAFAAGVKPYLAGHRFLFCTDIHSLTAPDEVNLMRLVPLRAMRLTTSSTVSSTAIVVAVVLAFAADSEREA